MKKYFTSIVSLVGMVLLIGVADGLDLWMDNLKRTAMSEFSVISSWLLPATIMELLFAGLLLTWLWYVTNKDGNHQVVNIILILVGLGLLFYNYLGSVSGLPLPMLMEIIPKSLSSYASAIVAMVGLQRMIFRKKEINK